MKKAKIIIIFIIMIISIETVQAKSGCCSWHKGVSGCSSNGRVICNDGTYSKSCTCTPPTVYGCTDSSAINYNNSANKDNGSCRYQKEVSETLTLDYEVEYQNPNNIKNGKEKVIQTGKEGQKVIKYKVIVDKNGTEISREKTSEVIVTQPVNEIVLIESIPLEIENTSNIQTENNKETQTEETDNSGIFLFGILILFIFNIIKSKNENKNFPILTEIKNLNNLTLKYISYFIYFIFILPVIIDFIIYIIHKMKK